MSHLIGSDVVLVHGYVFKGDVVEDGFGPLKKALEARGYRVHFFMYNSQSYHLEKVINKFAAFLRTVDPNGKCQVIACSLGAHIVARYLDCVNPLISKAVFFSPLVQGSRSLRVQYFLRFLRTQETGMLLYDACRYKVFAAKIPYRIPIGIIAGTQRGNARYPWLSLLTDLLFVGSHDGLIAVNETMFGDYSHIAVPVSHFDGIQNQEVTRRIIRFLDTTSFGE